MSAGNGRGRDIAQLEGKLTLMADMLIAAAEEVRQRAQEIKDALDKKSVEDAEQNTDGGTDGK